MVRMKRIIVLIYLCFLMFSFGRGLEMSSETNFFRQLALSTYETIIANKNELPKNFEDVGGLREWASKEPIIISFINRLAIVPLAPQVKSELGIQNKFVGFRLFAISRKESSDKVISEELLGKKSSGRYSILVKADYSDIFVMWIPEIQARIILKQLKGFDPEKQPLAFQDLNSEKEQRLPDQNDKDSSQTAPSDDNAIATAPPLGKAVTPAAGSALNENLTLWLAVLVVVILLGYLGVRYFRKKA